jgi:hypothetical protein
MAQFNNTNRNKFQDNLNNIPELVEEMKRKTLKTLRYSLFGVVMVIIGLVIFIGCPELINPHKIKGNIVDVIYVPSKDFKNGNLWVLTNGSYAYTSKKMSGNNSKDCYFCKKFIHIYDPVTKKIINRFNIKYDGPDYSVKLFYKRNYVFMLISQDATTNQHPEIIKFNAENGTIISTTKDFINRFPPVKSGIAELYYNNKPESLLLTSLDGQKCTYFFDCDTIFIENSDYDKYLSQKISDTVIVSQYLLAEDNKAPQRKNLYEVTGQKKDIYNKYITESVIDDSSSLYFFYKAKSKPLIPNKIFLEGYIVHSDSEYVIIVHQKQIGIDSDRLLTCINSKGKYMWALQQSELFPNLRLSSKDAFSTLFFIKSDLNAYRYGNMLIFKFKKNEIMGIDITTGKKVWAYIK